MNENKHRRRDDAHPAGPLNWGDATPIKTWRERIGVDVTFPLHAPTDVERAMEAEIAELRAAQAQPVDACTVPPPGWYCTRAAGHDGPCAAHPVDQVDSEGGHHD